MKLVFLPFLVLFSAFTFAQSIENFSIDNGGELLNSNQLQVVYTLGESSVNEFSNEALQVSQGFINSSILITSLSNKNFRLDGLNIYPNPTVDFLQVTHSSIKNRRYQIFNTIGQKIVETYLLGKSHSINVKKLSKGIYFLVIQNQENNQLQKLKFIKN